MTMAFEIIEETPAEPDEPATVLAWLSRPLSRREIGLQVLITKTPRGDPAQRLELIEIGGPEDREYNRVSISHDEARDLRALMHYAWGE
jgi:hypothetical protein